ncbi:methyl-accepting chemotaxis protein [Massilia niastensis]|uniref:methyl-accepting chemotaxis protein n=1 Tax=Massilia niastensis TaxID=544911 RepID=UPI00037810E9|nr:methyl-accepting chemotaxis protein [Massilia niastensis]
MKNLKIGARLGIGFAIVLALLAAVTVTALTRMQFAGDLTHRLVYTSIKNQRTLADWRKLIELNSARMETVAVATDLAMVGEIQQRMKASSVHSSSYQEELEKSLRNEGVKLQFQLVKQSRQGYVAARDAVFKAKLEGNNELAASLYREQLVPASGAYLGSMEKLATMQVTASDVVASTILDSYASTRIIVIVLGIAALVLGAACAWWITRSITAPIHEAVKVAEMVASGDLTSRIVVRSRDETGQLMQALRSMNDSLADIVGRTRAGTGAIALASSEIASGNQDLSARTEQQAGSLEETASSMEELTSTVRQNADNARQANRLASDAAAIAADGGRAVAEVVATMGSINASSHKIVDIIGVIDSIAFQTNILALNAAVEAARAGDQGRGFAVVATEVRNLAQRSATAAKEIKALIDDSVGKVGAGTQQVDQAGATMNRIVKSIADVTAIMSEIAHASEEQSAGIEQVNRAIAEMDRVTQQNAALVEEAAAAAESMQEQSGDLARVVSTFKLASTHAAPAVPAPQPRVAIAA